MSKGEEERGDASVGQVTGRWVVSGRGGSDASGRGKTDLDPYCTRPDAEAPASGQFSRSVRSTLSQPQRPVSLAGASGQHLAVEI